jgi:hypothetical protein
MSSRLAWWLSAWSAVLVASCGGSSGPPDPATYFATPTPYSDPACNVVDGALTGQREMHLFQSGAVDVLSLTQGLARYYKRHALTFFTNGPSQDAGTTYALDTNENALGFALLKQFPGVDFSNEQALMADPVLYDQVLTFAANFILRPMVDFARNHAAGPDVTNFVVVPDLERPGGTKLGDPGTSLAGLAISPALLAEFARTMPDEGKIWQGVQLPDGFTPMMFLGHNVIRTETARDPVLRDLVVSHEFGHTGGLPHSTVQNNLMFPSEASGRDTCSNALDASQLATMRTNLGVVSAAGGALTIAPPGQPAPIAPAASRRFTPAHLRALLAGDKSALRLFLQPFLLQPFRLHQ